MILFGPYDMVQIRLSDNIHSHVSGLEDTINFYSARFTIMDSPEGIESKISCLIEDMWTKNLVRKWKEDQNAS